MKVKNFLQNDPSFRKARELKVHSQLWDNFWQLKALQKWWKMLFISPYKFFSFSRYLSFFLDFLIMYKNVWIRKIRLILKLMKSQTGYQIIAVHILTNISRSKGNQRIKFVQLIECNMKTVILQKSFSKCGGETIPRPSSKN